MSSPRAGTAFTAAELRARFGVEPFLVRDALAHGVSRARCDQAVAAGRLLRLRHGVLVVLDEGERLVAAGAGGDSRGVAAPGAAAAGPPCSPGSAGSGSDVGRGAADGRAGIRAAALAAGDEVVVAGHAAARLLELPFVRPPARHRPRPQPLLLLPRRAPGREGRRADGSVVRLARLAAWKVVEVDGLRVTSPLRTAVDLARDLPTRFGVVPLDAAWRWSLGGADVVDDEARAHSGALLAEILRRQAGTVGVARARAAAALADPRSESPLESLSRVVVLEGGLPAPVPQLPLSGCRGEPYRGDLGWPRFRVVGECDGWAKYGTDAAAAGVAFRAEKRREDSLRLAGYLVVRWEWDDAVVRPQRLVDRVGTALSQRGWAA